MGIVKFSSSFLSGSTSSLQGLVINMANQSIAITGGQAGAQYSFLSGGSSTFSVATGNIGYFRIMSGSIPSNVESLTISTPPVGTTTLWQINAASGYSYGGFPANLVPTGNNWYTDPTIISSTFSAAIATGVASWFWIYTGEAGIPYGVFPDPTAIYHNIIGTIGTVGSGEDMEMLNTSIVAGQFLRIINLNLKMPAGLS